MANINFELGAPQVPRVMGETFGEGSGPRRQTGSELRPGSRLGAKNSHSYQRVLEGQMGYQIVPLSLLSHPIYICGSRMKNGAVRAIDVGAANRRKARF